MILYRTPTMKPFSSSQTRAFTLVEIMVVVTIIGILAALGMPALQRVQMKTRANALINDLRVYTQAFATHAQETSRYPRDSAKGRVPTGMADALGPGWTESTPIGGLYNYEYRKRARGTRYTAAIIIAHNGRNDRVNLDRNLLQIIDDQIDDGNLLTGQFLLGAGNKPFYVIER